MAQLSPTNYAFSAWATCPGNSGDSNYNEDSLATWDAENLKNGDSMGYVTEILKPKVDAATVNMGDKWRMPTHEDCVELFENTNYETVEIDGVQVGKFVNKTDASKYIFIPFAGVAAEGSFSYQGIGGDIWNSSVDSDYPFFAYDLYDDGPDCSDGVCYRYFAMSVRGVC